MALFFNFGEQIEGYKYKVINERDARASAGIMFLLGLLSLFSVYIFRTLLWAELFSITFIFEFFVRIVINPKYAPYMLLGGLIVSNQQAEWVEAKPKKFAWLLGLVLGAIMTYYIVFDVISLWRLGICVICLVLLFLESSFGICLGCLLYHKLNIKLNNCPGGVCAVPSKKSIVRYRVLLIGIFLILFLLVYVGLKNGKYADAQPVIIINDTQKVSNVLREKNIDTIRERNFRR